MAADQLGFCIPKVFLNLTLAGAAVEFPIP